MADLMAKRGVIQRHKEKGRVSYSKPHGWNGFNVDDYDWMPRGPELKGGTKAAPPAWAQTSGFG